MRTGAKLISWGALILAILVGGTPVGAITVTAQEDTLPENFGQLSSDGPQLPHDSVGFSRLDARPLPENGDAFNGSASRLRALLESTPLTASGETTSSGPSPQPAPKSQAEDYSVGAPPGDTPFSAEQTYYDNRLLNRRDYGAPHRSYSEAYLVNPKWSPPGGKPVRSSQVMLLSLQYTNFPEPPQPLVPIPEPATTTLLLAGLAGMVYRRHRAA